MSTNVTFLTSMKEVTDEKATEQAGVIMPLIGEELMTLEDLDLCMSMSMMSIDYSGSKGCKSSKKGKSSKKSKAGKKRA